MRTFLPLLALVVLALSGPSRAAAEIPVRTLSGYTITSWNTGEGIALGPVRAMAQDPDGYLWLGTDSGVLRFDGVHFTAADALPGRDAVSGGPAPTFSVRALHMSRSGELWIGTSADGLFRLRDGVLTPVVPAPTTGAVNAIVEDDAGTIWVGHEGGLLRFREGRGEPVGQRDGFPSTRVLHLRASGDGLYVGTSSGLLIQTAGGRFRAVPEAGDDPVRGTAEDATGALWMTDPLVGLRSVSGLANAGWPAGRGSELLRDAEGHLWLATIGQGLWRISTDSPQTVERVTVQNGLLTDGIWSLLEDREGNLWVGTHEGLNRLTRHWMTPVVGLGIPSTVVRGVDGTMWAASTDGVLAFPAGARSLNDRIVFPLSGVRTIHVSASGTVWAAAGRVFRLSNGRFSPIPLPPGIPLHRVTAMASDTRDTLWIADAAQGLWRWQNSTLEPFALPASIRAARITALHADREGTLWTAFDGGQLGAILADGSFTLYGKPEGLPHDLITAIQEGSGGTIWITGDRGLTRLRNQHFETVGRTEGLVGGTTVGVVEDADGAVWLSIGDTGIARLTQEEFAAAAAGTGDRLQLQIFDTSDGMAGMPTRLDSRTSARADDGRLWIVTGRGLTIVDPPIAVSRPRASGPVRVEAAVVDDRSFAASGETLLPAGVNRLRIDYTALSLTAPEHTRFRYRLLGFDDTWRDAGTRRQAFYTNLPPRAYRFQVEAAGRDGRLSATSADWSFSIAPRFYQTPIFVLLCIAGVALTVAGAWQLRLRHVRREFDIVLAERARLSREVHDTLLQTIVGVSLQIDNVAKTGSPESQHQAEQLLAIRREIEDCIVQARQSIWNLRATATAERDFIAALEVAGARATAGTPVKFRLRVTGTPFRAGELVERELLHIAQEALGNAVRHARATVVIAELQYQAQGVTLRVTDDGTGFESSTRDATHHFGLVTMRERAEQLGGYFSLTTALGAGTRIETSIPLTQRG